jgi:CheY-like chemotaxis protein
VVVRHGEILLVDDEPDMCWVLEHILKKHGFAVKKALSAAAALDLMEQHRFSLAFLDAKLPDMEGLELAKHLRQLNPALAIVMVSGYFYLHDVAVQRALSRGLIKGFISKPFQQEEILRLLES